MAVCAGLAVTACRGRGELNLDYALALRYSRALRYSLAGVILSPASEMSPIRPCWFTT